MTLAEPTVTSEMDKRWFLGPEEKEFRRFMIEQNRAFARRMKEVYFPEPKYILADDDGDEVEFDGTPEEVSEIKPWTKTPDNRVYIPIEVVEQTRRVLAKEYTMEKGPFRQSDRIIKEVANKYKITVNALRSPSRNKLLVRARREATFRLREELRYSFPKIGKVLGGQDHTTSLYNYRKFLEEAGVEMV